VTYAYLISLIAGLLLGVRLMFFGAERVRPAPGVLPLRRSEPAIVAFLVAFGLAGYLLARYGRFDSMSVVSLAASFAVVCAAIATRLAIATARIVPEHDPDDPRYALQGRVGVVTIDIPAGGEGSIRYEDKGSMHTVRARDIGDGAIHAGQEVCIERIDDGVAHVELWALVEQRL
jgi:membrane protein implicated in regulation of membrane protease activity